LGGKIGGTCGVHKLVHLISILVSENFDPSQFIGSSCIMQKLHRKLLGVLEQRLLSRGTAILVYLGDILLNEPVR
jgi:hypothetical protein